MENHSDQVFNTSDEVANEEWKYSSNILYSKLNVNHV